MPIISEEVVRFRARRALREAIKADVMEARRLGKAATESSVARDIIQQYYDLRGTANSERVAVD